MGRKTLTQSVHVVTALLSWRTADYNDSIGALCTPLSARDAFASRVKNRNEPRSPNDNKWSKNCVEFWREAASQSGADFSRAKRQKCDTGQSGAMQLTVAVALMPLLIFFAAYTEAVTHNALQWTGQPTKMPVPLGDLDPYLIHGSLGPPSHPHKRHLDRSSRFLQGSQT